jgi:hypothetical protein
VLTSQHVVADNNAARSFPVARPFCRKSWQSVGCLQQQDGCHLDDEAKTLVQSRRHSRCVRETTVTHHPAIRPSIHGPIDQATRALRSRCCTRGWRDVVLDGDTMHASKRLLTQTAHSDCSTDVLCKHVEFRNCGIVEICNHMRTKLARDSKHPHTNMHSFCSALAAFSSSTGV